jgi:dolichol-phosphate mannosyltransferase
MKKRKISVIIPTYNERDSAPLLVKEILQLGEQNNFDFEIIIIDDNSPDGTGRYIEKKYKSNPRVITHIRENIRGLSTAILYGIKKAQGDIIIGMDADFNHHPKYLIELIDTLKTADFVVASRFIKGGGMDDKFRYYITHFFNLVLKHILGFPTSDNMSGYYAIHADKLRNMPLEHIHRGYGEYHLRLVWEAKIKNYHIKEIPVHYQKRLYGKSKSNLGVLFFTYIFCAFRLRFRRK